MAWARCCRLGPLPLVLLLLQARLGLQAAAPDPAGVLLKFASAARGVNQEALRDWRIGTDPCTWTGVACSGTAVTFLRLPNAGLQGSLASELAQITSLRRINLKGNDLTGPLPPTWNMLDNMQYLILSGNALNGSLPTAWSSMGRLFHLDLSGNRLSGSLPPAWARQSMLVRLALAHNALSGSLPHEWGRLQSLLHLDLAGNELGGSLPLEWGAMQQATSIDLSGNQLKGGLPRAWARLGSLQMLSLQGNQLTGAIPSEWSALADRAFRISLGDNAQLCGMVPPPLGQPILIAGSSKKGSGLASPCSWEADVVALLAFKAGVATQQQQYALGDWLPQGNPCSPGAWFGVGCRGGRVIILNLAHAGLKFSSLDSLSSLDALEKVLLAGNNAADASLPASWAGLGRLMVADLSNTGVAGSLPPSWAEMGSLTQLLLSGNNLNGTLPPSWAALAELATLNVAHNALSGSLPPEWGAMASLSTLDASGNYLSGALPDGWADMGKLEELQLRSNNLAGAIPPSWAHLPSLALLTLSSNVGICGGQPAWRVGTRVHTEATNVEQSCIMVNTSGTLAGVVLGVSLSLTLASLAAVGAMLVFVRRQRAQLQLLQHKCSSASFSSMQGGGGGGMVKLASLHTFSMDAPQQKTSAGERFKALTIPPTPWEDEHAGYIQVPLATPHSGLAPKAGAEEATMLRSAPQQEQEHRSPSPGSVMPSPERHLWQVAAHAADRGVDLTARRARQKRLFRSRSEAPSTLSAAAMTPVEQDQQEQGAAGWCQGDSKLDMLRVHSRVALLPSDDGMV